MRFSALVVSSLFVFQAWAAPVVLREVKQAGTKLHLELLYQGCPNDDILVEGKAIACDNAGSCQVPLTRREAKVKCHDNRTVHRKIELDLIAPYVLNAESLLTSLQQALYGGRSKNKFTFSGTDGSSASVEIADLTFRRQLLETPAAGECERSEKQYFVSVGKRHDAILAVLQPDPDHPEAPVVLVTQMHRGDVKGTTWDTSYRFKTLEACKKFVASLGMNR